MTEIDYTKPYWKYCKDVLEENIVTGKYIKLACKRMLDWANRDDFIFNYEDVDKKIRFIRKMKIEGHPFELLPYQQWIVANIFGWYYANEPDIRVVTQALLLTARKSGKSTFAAALSLVGILCDNQINPEVAFISNNTKQAGQLFKYCRRLAKSLDPNWKLFHKTRMDLKVDALDATISILSADADRHDGRNDSMFIQDEEHATKNWELWNVMKTGQVQRKNPIAISISTAGFFVGDAYPLYNKWTNCCNILSGVTQDDTWFAAIYQLDPEDDWKDENVWIKANPSVGTTCTYKALGDQIRSAINTPGNEVSIRTKNLNQWMQSSNVWISHDTLLNLSHKVELEDYRDELAYAGIDFSVSDDLSSISVCIPPNETRALYPDKFIFKSWLYIPDSALEKSANKKTYEEFIRRGWAIKTSGNIVDYNKCLADTLKIDSILDIRDIAYDKFNANQFTINAENEFNLPMIQYSQTLGNFNKPTKMFNTLVLSEKCVIDTNPAVLWCFGNVEIAEDMHENQKPVKSAGDRNNKIDPVISMLEALGCYMESNTFIPSAWVIK